MYTRISDRFFVRVLSGWHSVWIPSEFHRFHGIERITMDPGFSCLHVPSVLGSNSLFHLGRLGGDSRKKFNRKSSSEVRKMLGCLKCKYENCIFIIILSGVSDVWFWSCFSNKLWKISSSMQLHYFSNDVCSRAYPSNVYMALVWYMFRWYMFRSHNKIAA